LEHCLSGREAAFYAGHPSSKTTGSKFTGKVEKGSAKLTKHLKARLPAVSPEVQTVKEYNCRNT